MAQSTTVTMSAREEQTITCREQDVAVLTSDPCPLTGQCRQEHHICHVIWLQQHPLHGQGEFAFSLLARLTGVGLVARVNEKAFD